MAAELFNYMTGVSMLHVPYRGQGPALSDLIGGQVQILFAAAPGTVDYVKTGKLRALAVTSATSAEVLKDCRRSQVRFPAMTRANGTELPRRKTRRPTSSESSTRRSTPPSPTPR
jgi:hypothetical protein